MCAHLLQDRRSGDHLSLFFWIQFFGQCVNIVFQHALTSGIKKMIALADDAYFRPPIIIRSHDLHVNNIRGAMGEIISYHMRD